MVAMSILGLALATQIVSPVSLAETTSSSEEVTSVGQHFNDSGILLNLRWSQALGLLILGIALLSSLRILMVKNLPERHGL